ncbi:hypothetical protein HKBW3S44_01870, partial [Candidatus Hakubella thermalkaliphila]
RVRTLTGHPARQNPFGDQVSIFPFNFDKPRELVKSLQGAITLYNTYWVRFSQGQITFDKAIENTKTLIQAAQEARYALLSDVRASPLFLQVAIFFLEFTKKSFPIGGIFFA